MKSTFRLAGAFVIASVLAGCGAQANALATRAPAPRQAESVSAFALDVDVDKLIADFKGIVGFEPDAMKRRAELVARLGDTDDDRALVFLQAEYENLSAYPEPLRPAFELQLVQAIDALDTYDAALDEPIIAAGAGTTAIEAASYSDALSRRRRKKGILYWVTSPFRWFGNGLRWLVTGKKPTTRRKRRRPRPTPGYPTDPSYPIDPSYPSGGGYGYNYR